MPNIDKHQAGMPIWVDAIVDSEGTQKALTDFYGKLFGWQWTPGTAETGFYSMALSEGQPVMGCGQGPGGEGRLVTYFATDDIDASAKMATELGGNVFMGPMKVMDVGAMALVLDPAGAVHGFWQPGTMTGFGRLYEVGAPGWFDHASANPDAASAYYSELLDKSLTAPEPGMQVLQNGDQMFASVSENQIPDRPAQWNAIYIVDSLERARHDVTKLGGTVVLEEMPVPGSAISVFVEPVCHTAMTIMQAGQQP
jgi:predicted enzyme related to lactoylglutathione lyase